MNTRHIQTVNRRLILEIGYASDIGPSGLTAAIREALERGGVVEEAKVTYLRSEAPEERLFQVDLWVPEQPDSTDTILIEGEGMLVDDTPSPNL